MSDFKLSALPAFQMANALSPVILGVLALIMFFLLEYDLTSILIVSGIVYLCIFLMSLIYLVVFLAITREQERIDALMGLNSKPTVPPLRGDKLTPIYERKRTR